MVIQVFNLKIKDNDFIVYEILDLYFCFLSLREESEMLMEALSLATTGEISYVPMRNALVEEVKSDLKHLHNIEMPITL